MEVVWRWKWTRMYMCMCAYACTCACLWHVVMGVCTSNLSATLVIHRDLHGPVCHYAHTLSHVNAMCAHLNPRPLVDALQMRRMERIVANR